jgi:nicotinate phosphoribosyltransferase
MKVARSAAAAGCGGTSNVAAAMRYGLRPVGTMAHSYVMSFRSEREAFRAFLADHPADATLLVDTYDTLEGARNAVAAAQETGTELAGVRLDSGDLAAHSARVRKLLDEAGMESTRITASGDLEEGRIAELVASGAPIDLWGVGTDLGTSRDSPVVNGVYKLVADRTPNGDWRGVFKSSEAKATLPGPKQVFRTFSDNEMSQDVIARADEPLEGEPLLVPAMRNGRALLEESLDDIRARSRTQLAALPERLRDPLPTGEPEPYSVRYSERLAATAS